MLKKIFAIAVLFVTSLTLQLNAATLKLNTQSSQVKWEGKKVLYKHTGSLKAKDGKVEINGNKITGGTINIDMTSLKVEDITDSKDNAKLVGHLKSDDFFSVDKHKVATYKITKIKENGGAYEITGDMTIKGITNPVTFTTKDTKVTDKSVTIKGQLAVDRTKFDVKFASGSFIENLGDKAIHDNFIIDLDLNFVD